MAPMSSSSGLQGVPGFRPPGQAIPVSMNQLPVQSQGNVLGNNSPAPSSFGPPTVGQIPCGGDLLGTSDMPRVVHSENCISRKKPRFGSQNRLSHLLLCFSELLTWMILNKKCVPEMFFMWALGDEYGWTHFIAITKNNLLQLYSLESLHRTVVVLSTMLKKPETWNSPISMENFRWFTYLYQNRHCLKASLVKSHPLYSILKRFRINPMETTLNMITSLEKERKEQNKIVTLYRREKSKEELQSYVGKILKSRDLKLPTSESVTGFEFVEPPTDIEHISDGVSFILRDFNQPDQIIGGRIVGAIPHALQCSLKKQMLQLMSVKPTVQRGAMRKAFCSSMCSFGATKNQEKGSSGKINFVVSKLNKRCKLPSKVDCRNTDMLLYKYGFTLLQELIILTFLRHFPEGVRDFLVTTSSDSGSPYLADQNVTSHDGIYGPLMWSLHVTMNYVNCMHIDVKDRSQFSLAVVSNTNKEMRGGKFYLLSHGVSFTQCDKDLFWFQAKKLHGTGYREPVKDPVLVGALVINSSVANIINSEFCDMDN